MTILQKDKFDAYGMGMSFFDGVVISISSFPNPLSEVAVYNFTITKGSELVVPLNLINEYGEAIPLTDYIVRCKIRKDFESEAIDSLTLENGRIVIYEDDGLVDLYFPKEETEKYELSTLNKRSFTDTADNTYIYDVFLDSSDGVSICILRGYIRIVPQVSY